MIVGVGELRKFPLAGMDAKDCYFSSVMASELAQKNTLLKKSEVAEACIKTKIKSTG